MIFNSIDSIKVTLLIFRNTPDITKNIFSSLLIQAFLPCFSWKYDVVVNLCIGRQRFSPWSSTLSGLSNILIPYNPRFHLGLLTLIPSGDSISLHLVLWGFPANAQRLDSSLCRETKKALNWTFDQAWTVSRGSLTERKTENIQWCCAEEPWISWVS